MYLDNKYTRWYYNIIKSAKNRRLTEYTEEHHIIPKCFYKMNSKWGTLNENSELKSNKVILTIKEHYIAHLLLTKMVDDTVKLAQMNRALERCININNKFQTNRYKIGCRKYQQIRQLSAKANSVFISGVNNPMNSIEIREKSQENTKIAMQRTEVRINHIKGINSKSWKDARSNRVGTKSPNVDKSTYLFIHRDGRLFDGTQMDLRQIHNVSTHVTDLIKGRISSTDGWELFYSPGAPNKRYKNKNK